jgi:hypothetical protein
MPRASTARSGRWARNSDTTRFRGAAVRWSGRSSREAPVDAVAAEIGSIGSKSGRKLKNLAMIQWQSTGFVVRLRPKMTRAQPFSTAPWVTGRAGGWGWATGCFHNAAAAVSFLARWPGPAPNGECGHVYPWALTGP